MIRQCIGTVLLFLGTLYCMNAQEFRIDTKELLDAQKVGQVVKSLSTQLIAQYKEKDSSVYLGNLFRLQSLVGKNAEAIATFNLLRKRSGKSAKNPGAIDVQHELYLSAGNWEKNEISAGKKFRELLAVRMNKLDNKTAILTETAFSTRNGVQELRDNFNRRVVNLKGKNSMSQEEAVGLCRDFYLYRLFERIEPLSISVLQKDEERRYIIDDSIIIRTKAGITISALMVRDRKVKSPQPTALAYTIYAEPFNLFMAKYAAASGYIGIVALTRGKGHSTSEIVPYECESTDVNEVIDWISKQNWSNGKVGMYGGSYNGFSQWAAAKHLHPALKTIVPYVAAIPGQGVPMENNIFITANYGWAFFTTNNRYLDHDTYNQRDRWDIMETKWFESGVAFNKIDSVDGQPNHWLQKWLQHPDYDSYWQSMVPYKEDFSRINIPVLSITGYYDDGQISALHYLREHYRYNPTAEHYLLIGPYDHLGAQRGGSPVLRDYVVDPIAIINTRELTFQWLDHILKGKPRPSLIKDKVNYQLMGSNQWKHASSLQELESKSDTFYLTKQVNGKDLLLSGDKPSETAEILQTVDLADRKNSNNTGYYPFPIISDSIDRGNGICFISEPFDDTVSISGSITGKLHVEINKRDIDIGLVFYEIMPDGRYFHLSYFLGRASYAQDMSTRHLLTPGKAEWIPFERTRMVSRQLSKGSRLMVVVNVNKNAFAQINYGTGKNVSEESIEDAGEELRVRWKTDSFIRVPIEKEDGRPRTADRSTH